MNLPFFNWVKKYLGFEFNNPPLPSPKPIIKMELYNKHKDLLDKAKVDTTLRLAHFFGQMKQESNFIPTRESLNYSVEALINMFGRHRISIEDAHRYGRKSGQKADQQKLANILYGGHWGKVNLGNTQPNDGWYFRGGGLKQITGRDNYTRASKNTGINFVSNPDLSTRERESMILAIWFWNDKNLNNWADIDDVAGVTNRLNGGTNGLDKRIKYTNEFKKIFANV